MEKMTVLEAFDEYEGETRVAHAKGDEISVSNERADQLRERGLARSKPASKPKSEASADEKPESA